MAITLIGGLVAVAAGLWSGAKEGRSLAAAWTGLSLLGARAMQVGWGPACLLACLPTAAGGRTAAACCWWCHRLQLRPAGTRPGIGEVRWLLDHPLARHSPALRCPLRSTPRPWPRRT